MGGITVRFTLPVIVLFLLVEGVLVFCHYKASDRDRKTIEFSAAAIGAATAIYSVLLGVQNNRVSAAAHFIERWNDPKAVDLTRGLRRILLEAKNLPVPQSLNQIDKETATTLALNFFEELSIAVHTKQVEEKVLKDFFRTVVLESFAALEQWIKQRRIERNQPTGYIEVEKLYRRWVG